MGVYQLPKQFHPGLTRPGVKPAEPLLVDESSPYAELLAAVVLANGSLLNDKTNNVLTRSNAAVQGPALKYTSSEYDTLAFPLPSTMTSYCTVWRGSGRPYSEWDTWGAVYCVPGDSGGTNRVAFTRVGSSTTDMALYQDAYGIPLTATIADLEGGPHTHVALHDTDLNRLFEFLDGKQIGEHIVTTEPYAGDDGQMFINSGRTESTFAAQNFEMFALYNGKVSPAFAQLLSADPYRILRPTVSPVYFTPGAAGGSYTLPADAGSIAITGQDANLEHHRSISAEAGSIAITGFDATLTYTTPNISFSVDAGAFAISGFDATLTYVPVAPPAIWYPQDPGSGDWTEQPSGSGSWTKKEPR